MAAQAALIADTIRAMKMRIAAKHYCKSLYCISNCDNHIAGRQPVPKEDCPNCWGFAVSESEDEPPLATNRGNKLKRKAEFYHEGKLGGTRPYKKVSSDGAEASHRICANPMGKRIEHAGYQRYIISRNPTHYDEFGEELNPGEEGQAYDAYGNPAKEDPFNTVQVEGRSYIHQLTRNTADSVTQHSSRLSQQHTF
jgi:hypothetical protein